jgi:hypothetical protein
MKKIILITFLCLCLLVGSVSAAGTFAYIDYTLATPVITFNQFGTLPSGYTAVLNISGSYEVT